jgi:predicted phage terminase large subunit-like protein
MCWISGGRRLRPISGSKLFVILSSIGNRSAGLKSKARSEQASGRFWNAAQFPTPGDKAVRAQSIRGRMELDGLYVPMRAPWYADFRAELLSFPAGKHDDQVDALGLIGQVLDRMTAGREPPKAPEKIRFANEMTMDEAWQLARPRVRNINARV